MEIRYPKNEKKSVCVPCVINFKRIGYSKRLSRRYRKVTEITQKIMRLTLLNNKGKDQKIN